ncbi:hypothetical protein AusDCA_3417 [Desulfitobacterium sp. AusDCA]
MFTFILQLQIAGGFLFRYAQQAKAIIKKSNCEVAL